MPAGVAAGKATADGACSKTQRDDHYSITRTSASSEVLVQLTQSLCHFILTRLTYVTDEVAKYLR